MPASVWDQINTTLNLASLSGLKQKIDPEYWNTSFLPETPEYTHEDRMSDIVVGIHRYIADDNLEPYLKTHFQASFNDKVYVQRNTSPEKLQYVLEALKKLSKPPSAPPAPPVTRAPRGTGGTRSRGLLEAVLQTYLHEERTSPVVRAPRAPRGLINPQHGVGASPVALRTRGAQQRRLQTTQRGRVQKRRGTK
jgi:hypothetical protein